MNLPLKESDAVVIGGGAIGCSIAYHLAKEDLKVALVEKHFIGAGTSTATFAWVGAHKKSPIHYHRFSRDAIDRWEHLSDELDSEMDFTRRGSLILLSEEEFATYIDSKEPVEAGPTLPPQGLCLVEVTYVDSLPKDEINATNL